MQIKYSRHIETRLALRKIEYDLPRRIYENPEERFTDTETGHTIAVMRAVLYGKERDIIDKMVYELYELMIEGIETVKIK